MRSTHHYNYNIKVKSGILMGNYYLLNSDDYYFNSSTWAENRLDLLEENAKLLSLNEANKLCLEKFCTKSDIDAKPNLS